MLIQLDQFVVEDLQPIMVTDSGLSSHPMVADVETPPDLDFLVYRHIVK